MEINRKTLGNGLVLLHVEKPDTRMVAVNTLYRVGSANDPAECTGMAHLVEHLMFTGTAQARDFDAVLQDAGGENNAYTCEDYTLYYDLLPAQNLETALWLESDRMAHMRFRTTSMEVQRKVVMEEFKLTELNQPYGDVPRLIAERMWPAAHPYSWPVIGKSLAHIRQVTLRQVSRWHRKFYSPSNAILSIVGGISWRETEKLVERYFGHVKAGRYTRPNTLLHPAPPSRRHSRTVSRNVPDNLLVRAYRAPSRIDADFPAADLISDILGNGKSSWLYRYFVEESRLLLSVDASVDVRMGESLLVIECVLAAGVTREQVSRPLDRMLYDRLCKQLVTEAELQKALHKYETYWNLQLTDTQQLAELLAYYELMGRAEDILIDLPNYKHTTPERIQSVARRIFRRSNGFELFYHHPAPSDTD